MATAQTGTFLFTDLVGSTEAHVRLGRASEALRRTHYELLRGALAASGGREVKNTGDGVMALYGSASGGVAGAIAIQRAFARHNTRGEQELGIRIGVSTGDAMCEQDDWFGTGVIEAARLCAAAAGGQALVSDVTRVLCGGLAEAPFVAIGELELKGLGELLTTWEIDWRAVPDSEPAPLPGGLARSAATGWFVGRDAELADLRGEWARAVAGERRCVMIEGEPGVGKTRLAAALAGRVHEDGGVVLLGRCDGDVGAPFAPWVEALRWLVAGAEADLLGAHTRAHGGELGRLVPELAERLPSLPAPRPADPETELLRLNEAAIGLLDAVADRQPVLLVLDDVHWADRPSLVLLRRLLQTPREAPMLVVATFRDVAADQREALRTSLADLDREPRVRRLALTGFDQAATTELLDAAMGSSVDPDGELAGELQRETEGNPLFATELLRHLSEAGAIGGEHGKARLHVEVGALGLPGTIRDVVSQRVERLGDDTQRALRTAAVIGRNFEFDVLVHAVGIAEDPLLDALDRARDASVVAESAGTPGRFSFSHALVQRALADELGEMRRARIHGRVAEWLGAVVTGSPERIGEWAHHWVQSGDRERGIDAAIQAGEHAVAVLAPSEAVGWFGSALELAGDSEDAQRVDLLTFLGEAERLAGEEPFREHLMEAARLALRLGDSERLVRAALANNRGMHSQAGIQVDDERVDMLKAALGAVDPDARERALLLATLASELWGADRSRRVALSDEAVSVARRLGDDRVLLEVLYRRSLTIAEPSTIEERMPLTAEVLELADKLGEPLWQLLASAERGRVAMEAADVDEARRHVNRQLELMETCGAAYGRHVAGWARPWMLVLSGRFDEAEAAATAAAQESASTAQPDAMPILGALLVTLRWEQGRLAEMADMLIASVRDPTAVPAFVPLAAHVLIEVGRVDEAAAFLAEGAAEGYELPRDAVWLTGTQLWGEAVARAGDVDWLRAAVRPAAAVLGRDRVHGCVDVRRGRPRAGAAGYAPRPGRRGRPAVRRGRRDARADRRAVAAGADAGGLGGGAGAARLGRGRARAAAGGVGARGRGAVGRGVDAGAGGGVAGDAVPAVGVAVGGRLCRGASRADCRCRGRPAATAAKKGTRVVALAAGCAGHASARRFRTSGVIALLTPESLRRGRGTVVPAPAPGARKGPVPVLARAQERGRGPFLHGRRGKPHRSS